MPRSPRWSSLSAPSSMTLPMRNELRLRQRPYPNRVERVARVQAELLRLHEQIFYDVAGDIGEPVIASLVTVREPLVIEAEAVKDRRL